MEPNSGLGQAISYLLKHWEKLTLFLRVAGAPIDNNLVERALKKAILHRKNSLFYKTRNGARMGDLFMSLIHTCELNGVNPFDYLTELQRHAEELKRSPSEWMPWNYRETLARLAGPQPRNMMNPAWPKRIICGHGWVTFRNGRQTGISKGKIAGFLARHENRRKCSVPACMAASPRPSRLCRQASQSGALRHRSLHIWK